MDVKPRNLPEQKPIEYWWPGEPISSPGLSFLLYVLAKNWRLYKPLHHYLEIMDVRNSVFYNQSMSPRSLTMDISSSVTPTPHVLPRHRKWKSKFAPIPPPLNLEIIEEEGLSEYDCGYLDLGAETPNSSNFTQNPAPFHLPTRRHSFRRASPVSANRLSKYSVDRDCGIWYAESIFIFPIYTEL